ncbi:MAG: Rpn family recombination-promoting nuclease/putative transposase, partial [Myxococcota bacterium]|nr:Rpn family recombination-promoting nuclease/putative transposase [Myxococcota bacterium]
MGAHDALFRHVFAVPEHAAAVLAHVLPPSVSAQIAWSTLRLEPGSFVDPTLAARHTDLLFSVQVAGQRALVYLLFEHQSGPHARMPLRMAGYVVEILEA